MGGVRPNGSDPLSCGVANVVVVKFSVPTRRPGDLMIEALEVAVAKLSRLDRQQQLEAAELIEDIAERMAGVYRLSADERSLVREGLSALDRGEGLPQSAADAIFDKYR